MKNIIVLFILLVFASSCKKDIDNLKELDNVVAPTNLTAIFDITQDNSGLVTIVPEADGVTKYMVMFGDTIDETPTEYDLIDIITHNYPEGVFNVDITAVGLTGATANYNHDLNVTYKAPEDLDVTITQDEINPSIVSVTAKATYATIMDVYFGDVPNEDPVHILPEEYATHTYAEPGDYIIRVVAKSAAIETTEFSDTITISAASDPVFLPVTFESFTVNYAFTDFGGVASTVIDNPDPSGINTTAKVAQSVKTSGAETWGGSFLTLGDVIDFSSNKLFKVKVWSPKSGAVVKLKVENLESGDIGFEVDALTTVTNQWEELQFDFSAIDLANTYQKVVIFFDFGNIGDDAIYYFDDIKLVPGSTPTTSMVENFEGEVPAFTVFGNIADVVVVANPDPTGLNTTENTAMMTKTSGSEVWAGCFFETDLLDLESFSKIKVKIWSPKSGIVVKAKLENTDASIVYEVDITNTSENSWEELVYDFSGAPEADYVRFVIFFDFGNPGDDTVYYFDEIELSSDGGGSSSVMFQDFEAEIPVFTVFGNIADIEVVSNPDPTGLNTTANSAKMVKTSGSEVWAGCFFESSELDLVTYPKIQFSAWSPVSGIVIKLKLENADASIVYEVDITNTTANAWEDLIYDFSDAPAADYVKVVVFFDFDNPGDDSVYYFDEFELTN